MIAVLCLTMPVTAAEPSASPSEKAPQMITVDVKLVEISQTKMRELGITLSQFDEKQVTKSTGLDCFNHVPTSAINGFVDALIKNKIACILSNPRVATLEYQEASLSIGSQVEKTTADDTHYVQHGTRLSVVPELLANDNVQLHFLLEWSGHSPTKSEQGEKNNTRNFELRTSAITPLGQSTLLTRSLEMAKGNDETILLLIVTPELAEATANAKNSTMK
jgi:type II secretory pathway component GspD/PulD (secretin)